MTAEPWNAHEDDDEVVHDEPLFERRMQVLALRNGGMTYRAIATHFEISEPTARRDEQWALRYVGGQDIETIINVQRSVILDMRRANYRDMLNGNKDAAKTILQGLDHEAKLLGLYAPVRVQTGPSHVEFSERAAQLIAEVAPDTLKELIRGTSHDPAIQPQRPVIDVETVAAEPEPVARGGDPMAAPLGFDPGVEPATGQGSRHPVADDAAVSDGRGGAGTNPDDAWSNI